MKLIQSPEVWTPRPWQVVGRNFLYDTPRANLFADMGLGKTTIVLWLIKLLDLRDVLVIGPKQVAVEVWPSEVRKWTQFAGLSTEAIDGSNRERGIITDAIFDSRYVPRRIHTIAYDNVLWLFDHLKGRWPFDTVIADESTRLKGFRIRKGTKRSTALARIAHKTPRWINLTGMPNPNGLLDLWGSQWFIDGGKALGRSYEAYQQRWFYQKPGRGQYRQLIPHDHAEKEIHERMKSTTLSLRTRDWMDVAEPIEVTHWVDLPPTARRQYQDMKRIFIAELERGKVVASNAAVKSLKLLQLASGAAYHSPDSWSWAHDAKLEKLDSIVTETGANLLVVYQFKHELERIRDYFKAAVDIHEKGAISRWNDGKIAMLCAHPKSAGHGLNLQHGGHHVVYFSPTWDLELDRQVMERIGPARQMQSGYDRGVYVHRILARDTIDPAVVKRRESKLDVLDALLEAMK